MADTSELSQDMIDELLKGGLVTIASGFAAYDFPLFVALCVVTRGARFFLVAYLLRLFGEPVREFIERRLDAVMWGLLIVIVGGFVAARYVV